jgi:hypothetical protein
MFWNSKTAIDGLSGKASDAFAAEPDLSRPSSPASPRRGARLGCRIDKGV